MSNTKISGMHFVGFHHHIITIKCDNEIGEENNMMLEKNKSAVRRKMKGYCPIRWNKGNCKKYLTAVFHLILIIILLVLSIESAQDFDMTALFAFVLQYQKLGMIQRLKL